MHSPLSLRIPGSRYHCTHLTRENGSSEEVSKSPKVTPMVSNLDLNPDPLHSLAHALSTRTKVQEQEVVGGLQGPRRNKGREGSHVEELLSPQPGVRVHTREAAPPRKGLSCSTFTEWLPLRLFRGNQESLVMVQIFSCLNRGFKLNFRKDAKGFLSCSPAW